MPGSQEALGEAAIRRDMGIVRGWRRLQAAFIRLPWSRREPRIAAIEKLLGIRIRNTSLYKRALRHRSMLRDHSAQVVNSNERLEFVGDAVLGLAVARYLYQVFPNRDEGFLTRMRSLLVNGEALAGYAQSLGLSAYIEMSENMERTGGRENVSILADAFEALLGAVYMEAGLGPASRFVSKVLEEFVDLDELVERKENFKSLLLELAQSLGWTQPRYQVVWERGPSHEKEFCVEVVLNNRTQNRGIARSKKRAEQLAAARTYSKLVQEIGDPSTQPD